MDVQNIIFANKNSKKLNHNLEKVQKFTHPHTQKDQVTKCADVLGVSISQFVDCLPCESEQYCDSCWGTLLGSERMDVFMLSSRRLFITTKKRKRWDKLLTTGSAEDEVRLHMPYKSTNAVSTTEKQLFNLEVTDGIIKHAKISKGFEGKVGYM